MTTNGTGVYFDGQTSRRQDVHVALENALALDRPDGSRLTSWPYSDLRELASPAGVLRLTREGGPPLARLEIRDPTLSAAIRGSAPRLGDAKAAESGLARKIVLWSVAAVVSMTLFAFYGIPALADRVTPLLPWSVDRRMGETADSQLRRLIPTEPGPFACGEGSDEKPGLDALERVTRHLSDAAALPVAIRIVPVRSGFVNAIALPGSPIYLFDGLIQRANSADEIAGVLAHEIGHVAHRDGTRHALQAGGASLLLGFILGDFIGGTAAITVIQAISEASYSRAAERQADLYAVELMKRIGADPRAVGNLLVRLSDEELPDAKDVAGEDKDGKGAPEQKPEIEREEGSLLDWVSSHPGSLERKRAIDAAAGPGPFAPIVDQADFLAIKRICGKPT